jgi:multidrug efflux pump
MRRTLGTAVFSGMLGVTLFGIFLTPIFFFAVDWLGDSHALASPRVRRIGTITLDVLTLRALLKASEVMLRRLSQPRRPPPQYPQTNPVERK